MALMPKRVMHRKSQRGRIKGNATRGNKVVFGDFGLQATMGGWLKARTIEAGRIAAQQYVRGEGRLYIRIFQISRFRPSLWKLEWVRVRGSQNTGSPLFALELFCTNWVVSPSSKRKFVLRGWLPRCLCRCDWFADARLSS